MTSPDIRPSSPSPESPRIEQDEWRDQRMYGANAFIRAMDIAEAFAQGRVTDSQRIGALTAFTQAVFETTPVDETQDDGITFQVIDVNHPDGTHRRMYVRPGGIGFRYDYTMFDVDIYGEEAFIETDRGSFSDLARDLVY